MEMHQIRYFLSVAETLNFTRAADACHVAQPSLSRAIKRLEEELGGDLFRRERSRTHLTELGRTMLPFLRQSYEAVVAAKAQADCYGSAVQAPLRLGLSLTVELKIFGPILAELKRAYPGLDLQLQRGSAVQILEALKAGEVELAIVADEPADWERFDNWILFEEEFGILAPPGTPLSGRDRLTIEEIAEQDAIARPYCESTVALHDLLKARGITLTSRHAAASDDDARTMAGWGLGVSILPKSAVGEGAATADLDFSRRVRAYAVAGRERPAAAGALLRLLRTTDWSKPPSSLT